jgi:hypothetical protein
MMDEDGRAPSVFVKSIGSPPRRIEKFLKTIRKSFFIS